MDLTDGQQTPTWRGSGQQMAAVGGESRSPAEPVQRVITALHPAAPSGNVNGLPTQHAPHFEPGPDKHYSQKTRHWPK